jgi:hypothetical protein
MCNTSAMWKLSQKLISSLIFCIRQGGGAASKHPALACDWDALLGKTK